MNAPLGFAMHILCNLEIVDTVLPPRFLPVGN